MTEETNKQESDGPSLQEILIPIWANRKRILVISFAAALVTLAGLRAEGRLPAP